MMNFKVSVLLTCHNRCEMTVESVDRVLQQGVNGSVEIYLVDDGSSDGTSAAVRAKYPHVKIIEGDGSLYWNGGMRLAWKTAAEAADWDAYLWLNDDTFLLDGALSTMVETLDIQECETGKRGIVVGSCRSPLDLPHFAPNLPNHIDAAMAAPGTSVRRDPLLTTSKGLLTYGGRNNRGLVQPGTSPKPVEAFNGNCVLVSKLVFESIGNLAPHYRHHFGDIDYGIRARRSGFPIWLAPRYQAICEKSLPLWQDPSVSLPRRLNALRGPKGISIEELRHISRVRRRFLWPLDAVLLYLYAISPQILHWRLRRAWKF